LQGVTVKLPNAERAIIPSDKLTDYLLSKSHLIGRWKARFFLSIGFSEAKADELKDALMYVAKTGEVKSAITTDFGVKYTLEGVILGPSGRSAAIRTVWIVETGQDRPRLITSHPL
jgi:predicted ATP-grasp superfamily ATP-dependent carboligase